MKDDVRRNMIPAEMQVIVAMAVTMKGGRSLPVSR